MTRRLVRCARPEDDFEERSEHVGGPRDAAPVDRRASAHARAARARDGAAAGGLHRSARARLGGRARLHGRLDRRRARRPGPRARRLPHGRDRPRERLRRGRRRRRPARLPEHLPPPRRAHRPGPRGPPPARAVPVPRLVLRLRRLAAQRAAHRRDRGLRPAVLRAARGARGRGRGRRHDRPVGHRAGARRARRRHGARAGALSARRPAPRAADRVRRRRQLEGDRGELQRVPALSGRPSRAQPAQPLPLGRDAERRRRVVRRLDDAARRRGDDGPRRRRTPARRSTGSPRTTSARSSTTCCSPTR